jgi:magnesium-transporting ATPase (P-type)
LEKGSQTEIALLKVIRKIVNKNEVDVRREVGLDGYFKRLPFDSSRKRITTGMTINNQDIIFMSGASEQIL